MRIIAGEYRGRRLQAPKGDATRPTTDRVRESLMSAIASARGGFDGAVVLDAFAGSGALGLEALSRGAGCVHFYEKDKAALRALCANVESLGLSVRGGGGGKIARVYRCDVLEKPPTQVHPPFDLVFLDPPYAYPAALSCALLRALADGGALGPRALVSFEHDLAANDEVDAAFASQGFILASRRKYGDTVVDLLKLAGNGEEDGCIS